MAVVGEPFAGRDVLVEYADKEFGAASQRLTIDGVVESIDDVEFPTAEVIVVEGCEYLYTRQIGGYDVLDDFLTAVIERDAMSVTSWNRYAWDYLSAIRDIEHTFPVQVRIPTLEAKAVTGLLLDHFGPGMPAFVQTDAGSRVKPIGFTRQDVGVGSRSVGVPVPELNLGYITSHSQSNECGDVEAVVFQKVAYLSDGNPGVAGRLWERSVRDGEIAPAYVGEVEGTLERDDEAFLLELVLAKGEVSAEMLQDILLNVPVHRSLGTLANKGVLSVSGGTVSPVPERLYATVEHLRGRQLIC